MKIQSVHTLLIVLQQLVVGCLIVLSYDALQAFPTHDSAEPEPQPEAQWFSNESLAPIIKAFEQSSAEQLSLHFNPTVEIITPTGEGVYSKSQATRVMQRFFQKNQAKSCVIMHKEMNSNGSRFVVLTYTTQKEQFRITLFLKEIDNKPLIQEIDIVKQI